MRRPAGEGERMKRAPPRVVVLKTGSVPPEVLAQVVDQWIAGQAGT